MRKPGFILFLFCSKASAQKGNIEGIVINKHNNTPLNNVTVSIPSVNRTELSNEFEKTDTPGFLKPGLAFNF